jgi:hypothetical protein
MLYIWVTEHISSPNIHDVCTIFNFLRAQSLNSMPRPCLNDPALACCCWYIVTPWVLAVLAGFILIRILWCEVVFHLAFL